MQKKYLTVLFYLCVMMICSILAYSCRVFCLGMMNKKTTKIPQDERETDIIATDNISQNMLSASYWTQKIDCANKILMTDNEIDNYNTQISLSLLNEQDAYYNLDKYNDNISKSELINMIKYDLPKDIEIAFDGNSYNLINLKNKVFANGKQADNYYIKDLIKNENISQIKAENVIKYGIVTTNSDIRMLPTTDAITYENEKMSDDIIQKSEILINEPVVILHTSADQNWFYILSYYSSGWICKEDIGIFNTKSQWEDARKIDKCLIVTGSRIYLEENPYDNRTSKLELSMGTMLELADKNEIPEYINNRLVNGNYIIKLPVRDDSGNVEYVYEMIPINRDVNIGYVPYTSENVINLAFKMLGDCYGWGGAFDSRDCSGLVFMVYRCFGFKFPRNSSMQSLMPGKTYNMDSIDIEERQQILEKLMPGSILFFPGHIMIYLGNEQGYYYVISAAGIFIPSNSKDCEVKHNYTISITDLTTMRPSKITWLEALTCAKEII